MTEKKKVVVTMKKLRETKGTVVFMDDDGDALGQIYIPKHTLADLDNPTTLTLTIESAE